MATEFTEVSEDLYRKSVRPLYTQTFNPNRVLAFCKYCKNYGLNIDKETLLSNNLIETLGLRYQKFYHFSWRCTDCAKYSDVYITSKERVIDMLYITTIELLARKIRHVKFS